LKTLLRTRIAVVVILLLAGRALASAQMENVPVKNQVYEFLNRMGVKGILPLYTNTMVPLTRKKVAEHLKAVESRKDALSQAERGYLEKFEREFMHEIDPAGDAPSGLFNGDPVSDAFADKEKYLYHYSDSTASLFVEFLGSAEYRRAGGDSYGSAHASLENHGFRARGTVKNMLGYYLQATNGTLYGDRAFALSDRRLRGNVKFNDLDSPYFDFTEAYLQADLSWFTLQFGREYSLVGTGYSDRLLLSENAPVFDFLKLQAEYKSIRFMFLHASLVGDTTVFSTIPVTEPAGSSKYLAMHRVEVSLFDRLRLGASEMVIYQRLTPEFGYLNPVNFYKSAEHSLRDRDNAFLNFDFEYYPLAGYKLYGSWLIDDIDFSRMGTGWWGNEFGWQGGVFASGVAGLNDVDAVVEYTRLEPYVYSNRLHGNDYTHNKIGLGHHLEPNSDEWFGQISYRPCRTLRTWCTVSQVRHGENVTAGGAVVRNVGGNALEGHRDTDSPTVRFLDGNGVRTTSLEVKASFEPVTNLIFTCALALEHANHVTEQYTVDNRSALVRVELEY
jgi:hypothetical protein